MKLLTKLLCWLGVYSDKASLIELQNLYGKRRVNDAIRSGKLKDNGVDPKCCLRIYSRTEAHKLFSKT